MKPASREKRVPASVRPVLQACKRIIREQAPGAEVVLFGSRARGDGAPDSDYDLLVLTDGPLTSAEEDRISDAVYGLELERGVVISLIFFARDYWDLHRLMPLHQEVDEQGIVL